jgi:hypothetical protein
MDEIWTLISLSLAMLIGCYLSGLIPLAITFSEVQLFFYNPLFKFINSWSIIKPKLAKDYDFLPTTNFVQLKKQICLLSMCNRLKNQNHKAGCHSIPYLSFLQLVIINCLQFPTLLLSEVFSIILSSMICHLILIYPLCTILHIQLSIHTSVSSHLINISSRVMKAKVETSKKSSVISDLHHFPYNDKMMFSNIKKCCLLIIVWKVSTKSKH